MEEKGKRGRKSTKIREKSEIGFYEKELRIHDS
jgi:hypothetical protein